MSAKLTLKIEKNILDGLSERAEKALRGAVAKTAFKIERTAKRSITQMEKTGHIYLVPIKKKARWIRLDSMPASKKDVPKGWKVHQASAPGEAPAGETGTLANTIHSSTAISGPIAAEVSVTAEYAPYLEYGSAKVAARPFLTPAVDAAREDFQREIATAIRKGLQP